MGAILLSIAVRCYWAVTWLDKVGVRTDSTSRWYPLTALLTHFLYQNHRRRQAWRHINIDVLGQWTLYE